MNDRDRPQHQAGPGRRRSGQTRLPGRSRVRRVKRRLYAVALGAAIGVVPLISAFAGSVSIPVLRDNATGEITRMTAPVTDQTNKVIAPASGIAPKIGETTAPINDSAMFRANTALQNQIASGSVGYISP